MKLTLPLLLALLGLCACGSPPPPAEIVTVRAPALAVAPGALSLTAGDAAVELTAVLAGGTGPIAWTLDGPGTLSATSGARITYAPPPSLDAATTATLTASAGDLAASVVISLSPPWLEWVVDPTQGADTNAGTADAPLQSLHEALSRAHSGQRILLRDGTYDANGGEVWPAIVPEGVSLEALDVYGAVLTGSSGQTALLFVGGGAVKDLAFLGFTTAIRADHGELTVTHLLSSGAGLVFSGIVKANLAGVMLADLPASTTGILVSKAAQVTVTGGALNGTGYVSACQGAVGLAAGGDSRVTLTDVTFENFSGDGLSASGDAQVSIQGGAFHQTGQSDCSGAQLVVADSAALGLQGTDVSNGNSNGIVLYDAATRLGLADVTLGTHPGDAVVLQGGYVQAQNVQVSGCSGGFELYYDARADLSQVSFSNVGTAVFVSKDGRLTLRNSTVSGGGTAVSASGNADLGHSGDPGGNIFHAGTTQLTSSTPSAYLQAGGNVWVASQQGADAQGHYASQTLTGQTSGKNFTLAAGVFVQL